MDLLNFILNGGEVFDSKVTVDLLKNIDIANCTVLADRAYGSNDIREYLAQNKVISCIPDKKSSKIKHSFDKEGYKQRNIIERFLNKLKNYRHSTQYDKLSICFWNFVALTAIRIKLK